MIKKSIMAIVTILLLVTSLLGEMQFVEVADANPFSYSLDGNANSTLNILKTANIYYYNALNYTVFKTLENLANGNHKIIVYAHFSNNTISPILSSTIKVDTTFIPPIPFMISPLIT